jgi:ATP-dependent protease Clp ATPase subunit
MVLKKKIASRLNTRVVGYNAAKENEQFDKKNLLQYIAPQDLKSFGSFPKLLAVSHSEVFRTIGQACIATKF